MLNDNQPTHSRNYYSWRESGPVKMIKLYHTRTLLTNKLNEDTLHILMLSPLTFPIKLFPEDMGSCIGLHFRSLIRLIVPKYFLSRLFAYSFAKTHTRTENRGWHDIYDSSESAFVTEIWWGYTTNPGLFEQWVRMRHSPMVAFGCQRVQTLNSVLSCIHQGANCNLMKCTRVQKASEGLFKCFKHLR